MVDAIIKLGGIPPGRANPDDIPSNCVIDIGTEFNGNGGGDTFDTIEQAAQFAAQWIRGLDWSDVGSDGDVRLIVGLRDRDA
ncbi:hypothetical protein P409_00465 [Inquilinus limosus MP06]|uniref:Uncharacterized protein n=2 Tax=Inquilinus limosus TaxID=171674 RepID=A0A0A0DDF5_9PROT|nr:hypothetical protein P409_00465 [Inquilinus limosus MP06]